MKMLDHYAAVIDLLVYNFGGYALRPGGNTMMDSFAGIVRYRYPDWAGWTAMKVNQDADLRSLTHHLYRQVGARLGIDHLSDDRVAASILDMAMGSGEQAALRCILKSIVVKDKEIDLRTATGMVLALHGTPTGLFLARFAANRILFHLDGLEQEPGNVHDVIHTMRRALVLAGIKS